MEHLNRQGFVYVMVAPGWSGVKIGRSTRAPQMRARELSQQPGYRQFGKWEVVDYRRVTDAIATEGALHKALAASRSDNDPSVSELFKIDAVRAVEMLVQYAEADLVGAAPIGRLRLDEELVAYLRALFTATGLEQFLDLQEMWTFSLYPRTGGGRLFTLNIDRHEVAYATPDRKTGEILFMLHLDRLALEAPKETKSWLRQNKATTARGHYTSGDPRGVSLQWLSSLDTARQVFELPLIRRALLAYWYEALLDLRDRGKRSFFARHHNHNAVQELFGAYNHERA